MQLFSRQISRVFCVFACAFVTTFSCAAEPIVNGYFRSWGIYGPNFQVMDVQGEYLTHLTYSNLRIDEFGNILFGDEWADRDYIDPEFAETEPVRGNLAQLQQLKSTYPHLKLMVSIGGGASNEAFKTILVDEQLTNRLIANIGKLIKLYQLDGVEMDWQPEVIETPLSLADHDLALEELLAQEDAIAYGELYNQFISRLRLLFDQQSTEQPILLAVTLPYYPVNRNYWDPALIQETVNYFVINTHFLHGSWDKSAHHMSPLYVPNHINNGTQASIDTSVRYYLVNAIQSDKLVFNVAPIALGWQFAENSLVDIYQPISGMLQGSNDDPTMPFSGVFAYQDSQSLMDSEQITVVWDNNAKAMWGLDYQQRRLYSFESVQSMVEKLAYAQGLNLGGISMTDLHLDARGDDSLLAASIAEQASWQQTLLVAKYWAQAHLIWLFILLAILLLLAMLYGGFAWFRHQQLEQSLEQDRLDALQEELGRLRMAGLMAAQYINRLLRQPKLTNQSQTTMAQVREQMVQHTNLGMQLLPIQATQRLTAQFERTHLPSFLSAWALAEQNAITIYSEQPIYVQLDAELFYVLLNNVSQFLGHTDMQLHLAVEQSQVHLQLTAPARELALQHLTLIQQLQQQTAQQSVLLQFEQNKQQHRVTLTLPFDASLTDQALWAKVELSKQAEVEPQDDLTSQNESDTEESTANAQLPAAQTAQIDSQIEDRRSNISIAQLATLQQQLLQCQSGKEVVDTISQMVSGYAGWTVEVQDNNDDDADNSANHYVFKSGGLDGYQLLIQSEQQFNDDELQLFKVLQLQLDRIHQHLLSLTKQPQLLADLYEIASNKEQLCYIKADHGYATLSFTGRKGDKVISLRLRSIMQFFDDSQLLQLHRSWLVNPNKVVKVYKVAKNKYELLTNNDVKIPVARNYLPQLQRKFPHWFI